MRGSGWRYAIAAEGHAPDFIVAEPRLQNDTTGIEAIHQVHRALGNTIPAVLISGDTASDRLREISAAGLTILHKPLEPMRFRALLNHEFARKLQKQDAQVSG